MAKFSFGKWFGKIVSHIPNSWDVIHNEALLFLVLSKELIGFVVVADEARYSGQWHRPGRLRASPNNRRRVRFVEGWVRPDTLCFPVDSTLCFPDARFSLGGSTLCFPDARFPLGGARVGIECFAAF
jgi:hypothetical protein